jgi:hypothetical protein
MGEEIKDDFEANILNADGVDSITIEGTNGKEYRIVKQLPVKAGNIFNSYMSLYGLKAEPETAAEISKAANMAFEYTVATIAAQNEKTYPDLTIENIVGTEESPGIFTEDEIGYIHYMYLEYWLKKANRKMRSKTKDNKKKETEGKKETKDA